MPRPERKNEIIGRPERFGWNQCHDAWTEYLGSEEFERGLEKMMRLWQEKHLLSQERLSNIMLSAQVNAIINHLRGKDK